MVHFVRDLGTLQLTRFPYLFRNAKENGTEFVEGNWGINSTSVILHCSFSSSHSFWSRNELS